MTARCCGWWKPSHCNIILLSIKKVTVYFVTIFDFDQLWCFRVEWSVAPWIIDIKAQGLAHCLLWVELSYYEVYKVSFHTVWKIPKHRFPKKIQVTVVLWAKESRIKYKSKLAINTEVHPMPINDLWINIWFSPI